jgi:hypothetical protein
MDIVSGNPYHSTASIERYEVSLLELSSLTQLPSWTQRKRLQGKNWMNTVGVVFRERGNVWLLETRLCVLDVIGNLRTGPAVRHALFGLLALPKLRAGQGVVTLLSLETCPFKKWIRVPKTHPLPFR